MTHPWIEAFFQSVRDTDLAGRLLALQSRSEPLNWDGTTIKDHLTTDDWKSLDAEISEQLKQKNDRGVAITCAASVEDRLRWLIETKFIDGLSETKKDRIFTGLGPLSSFLAKTEIAFALGLIKPEVREQLQIIGQIRNKFAHNFRRVRFSDPKIAEMCERLRKFDKEGFQAKSELREVYGFTCLICMMALFVTGQLVLASRAAPSTSPEKSE
ncbi:MAG: MltR family transcriptional regulator [Xanthobacteraceae bacterium]